MKYCQKHGIQIYPASKIVNIEGTGNDTIDYWGNIEAKLSLLIGNEMFEPNALLLVLVTTEYHESSYYI